MNLLQVFTQNTDDPLVFDTYWMTGLVKKGRVRTTVFVREECAKTVAELVAIQYLLEQKNACGHDKSGSGLRLCVSQEEVLALANSQSQMCDISDYAIFLKTRFLGAELSVCVDDSQWADELCDREVDEISVYSPDVTCIEVDGIGKVKLTAHAVQRYVQRTGRDAGKAWRDLVKLGKNAAQISYERKEIHNIKHKRRGLYFRAKEMVLVITPPDRPGCLPRLVTVTDRNVVAKEIRFGAFENPERN